jgi:glycosyltransferase involved in cell wall biosynthesis
MTLGDFDVVISSTSGWAHAVDAGDALHIAYCHTPPRWLYRTDTYLADAIVPPLARPMLSGLLSRLRRWDQRAARRPDLYVANSHTVARRIAEVYGRRSVPVIYPPVQTLKCCESAAAPDDDYFLVVSRLLPYKRVDLVIDACAALGRRLVIVGSGPLQTELKARAGADVEFRPVVTDDELACLMAGATALVQAGEEDFGIVPLEANNAGRPVVAFAAGGALDTVESEISGVLFSRQTVDALVDALRRVESRRWDSDALRAHAASFSESRFIAEMSALIDISLSAPQHSSAADPAGEAAAVNAG